jgi:hypothetical protein
MKLTIIILRVLIISHQIFLNPLLLTGLFFLQLREGPYLAIPQTVVSKANYYGDQTQGLFIRAEVIPVSEKTFRQVYERDLALLRK